MRVNKSAVGSEARRSCLPGFLAGFLLGILAFVIFVRAAKTGTWNHLAAVVTGRSLAFNPSQPTIVNKIQRLQRLETVTYSLDKIIEGDRESSILPNFLAGDKLLLVVHGDVIAGVDLSKLKSDDIAIYGKTVQVHLPQPQILVTALDNTKTRVFSRKTGFLIPQDPNLESEVRANAQNEIQQAALTDGILDIANKNAKSAVRSMLLGLGFEHVVFD